MISNFIPICDWIFFRVQGVVLNHIILTAFFVNKTSSKNFIYIKKNYDSLKHFMTNQQQKTLNIILGNQKWESGNKKLGKVGKHWWENCETKKLEVKRRSMTGGKKYTTISFGHAAKIVAKNNTWWNQRFRFSACCVRSQGVVKQW